MPLLRRWRSYVQMTVSAKHRTGHLAVHLSIKIKAPAPKRELSRIPVHLQIADFDNFPPRQQPAQLPVERIRICLLLSLEEGGTKEKKQRRKCTGACQH